MSVCALERKAKLFILTKNSQKGSDKNCKTQTQPMVKAFCKIIPLLCYIVIFKHDFF